MTPLCLEVIFKSPVEIPPSRHLRPSSYCMCVFVGVCVSGWVQALLGFSGVWTAGRVLLIGQNDAEMDRKPLLSSSSSFSISPTFTLSLYFNHSLIFFLPLFLSLSSPFCSSLHQHHFAFSALAVTRARCCSTNFSHPFIPAIWPFPKSTLSQRGEAFSLWLPLHSNFSLFCSSLDFFRSSFFQRLFSPFYPIFVRPLPLSFTC